MHEHNVFLGMPFRNSHVSSGAKVLNTEGCPQNLPASDKYSCRGGRSVADLYTGEYNGLPDRDVRTVRDLIHYQYAKIIARSAFSVPDGTAAKGNHYGFIKQTFREPLKKLFTYSSPCSHPRQFMSAISSLCTNVPYVRHPTCVIRGLNVP